MLTSFRRRKRRRFVSDYSFAHGDYPDINPVDSAHVESIVLLSKLHAKQNIEVELKMSELDLTAAERKATYEESSNTGKQIINQIPINRIFVESDDPFTKVLGRKYTVEKLSAIYEVDVLKRQVTHNYLTLIKEDY